MYVHASGSMRWHEARADLSKLQECVAPPKISRYGSKWPENRALAKKDEPSSSVSVYSLQACFGVWSPDRRDTLSLPRPTCWFFSAFLKWFGQPFISVVSHMRSVLNCWSKRILGDRWTKTENSVINLMSFQMFFIEYKRRDFEKCAGRSFPCKYNEWGLQRASRKGFKL